MRVRSCSVAQGCRALTLLVLALLALAPLSACGPVAHLRPIGAVDAERPWEIGAGAAVVTPKPYAQVRAHRSTLQLWGSHRVGAGATLSAIAALDAGLPSDPRQSLAAAAGVAGALDLLRSERGALGAELELGAAWAATLVPMSLRLFDRTRVFAAPRFGFWGDQLDLGGLAGASAQLYGPWELRAELRATWPDLDPFERRLIGSVGVAYGPLTP